MKYRLFIAADPPAAAKESIIRIQDQLSRSPYPVLWESSDKLHLTLNFIGATPPENLAEINRIVSSTASRFAPFTLTPAFLETLYQRHEQSLIYLGFSGDIQKLRDLQSSLSLSLTQISIPQPRRFLPHLTIGRLKRTDPPTTKRFLDQMRDLPFTPLPAFQITAITLYRSFLSRQGSTYQKLATFPLQLGNLEG